MVNAYITYGVRSVYFCISCYATECRFIPEFNTTSFKRVKQFSRKRCNNLMESSIIQTETATKDAENIFDLLPQIKEQHDSSVKREVREAIERANERTNE